MKPKLKHILLAIIAVLLWAIVIIWNIRYELGYWDCMVDNGITIIPNKK